MKSRILIISNAAVSLTDSNGRTIAKLLDCFDKSEKAQFFTYGTPDFSLCDSFYKVSDYDALNSVFRLQDIDGTVASITYSETAKIKDKPSIKKTPLVMILREVIWKFGFWKNKHLYSWIDNVAPKCVFLYLGDNAYTIDLAIRIARNRNIPILAYSTEEYPFKKYNYITKKRSLLYPVWNYMLKHSYKKLNKYVKLGLFNSEDLTEAYAQEYTYPCRTLYQNSDIDFIDNSKTSRNPKISYLGNLGLDRHKPLIEIAEALQKIDSSLIVDVYGNATKNVVDELKKCHNIAFRGFVSYKDVINIIHSSTLLLHAEFSDKFYNLDLKYAFSTKITDSICSGTPLFLYASKELAGTKFVIANQCAFHCEAKDQLMDCLRSALFDEAMRKNIINHALVVKDNYLSNKGIIKKYIEEMLSESFAG